MTNLKHTDLVLLENHDGIILARGDTSYGDKYYAYIKAGKDGIQKMYRDKEEGRTVSLFKYGEIVAYGKGEEPSENIRQQVADRFGGVDLNW